MSNLIELLKQPSILYLIIGTLIALTPIISKSVKWFWTSTKADVKKEVINELKEDNQAFKDLMHEQMEVVKDTVDVVKDSIEVMKSDGKMRQKQHEGLMKVMDLHITELVHMRQKVDNHEERIEKIEKVK
jgi:hypothetical protein